MQLQPVGRPYTVDFHEATEDEKRAENTTSNRVTNLFRSIQNLASGCKNVGMMLFGMEPIEHELRKDPYLSVVNFAGNSPFYSTANPVVLNALLEPHRNSGIFKTHSKDPIKTFMIENRSLFEIEPEDMTTICDPEHTARYNSILHSFFSKNNLQAYYQTIFNAAEGALQNWSEKMQPSDISREIRIYQCKAFTDAFFGEIPATPLELIKVFKQVAKRLMDLRNPDSIPVQKRKTTEAVRKLNETIEAIIANKKGISPHLAELTKSEQKSVIFTLLVYGTASNLPGIPGYAFLRMAEDKDLQDTLFTELTSQENLIEGCLNSPLLKSFIIESMRMTPSMWSLYWRRLKHDAVLDIKSEKGDTIKHYYLPAKRFIVPRPECAAKVEKKPFQADRFVNDLPESLLNLPWLPFGSGPHRCPGSDVFLASTSLLLGVALSRYRIELPREFKEPKPEINFSPTFKVEVKLTPRQ